MGIQQPNPALQELMRRISGEPPAAVIEAIRRVGTPLFTEDQITETTWDLDKLLRRICVEHNITEEYFSECYKNYACNEYTEHVTLINNQKTNLLRTMKAGFITMKTLKRVLAILNFTVVDMSLKIMDVSNRVEEYKLSNTSLHRMRLSDNDTKCN